MRKLLKMLSPVIGVILVAQLLGSQAVVFATPEAPVAPDTSATCVECDTAVTDLNAAYADFAVTRDEVAVYGTQIESLLAQTTEISYVGNTSEMVDHLTAEVVENHLLEGAACEDSANTFAYYSSFSYEGVLYCIENEAMWVGPDPYFNFLQHMGFMTEGSAPELSPQWYSVWDEMIELLMDHDGDLSANLTDEQINIDSFFDIFDDCDLTCPEPEPDPEPCPDCDTIADNLEAALDALDALELEAEALNDTVNDLEAQIAAVEDQFLELEQLRTDLRQMVEDAGGQTDEACDGFTPESGQSWGVAHTFGDVTWCFTSEGQLEDMIANLDDYWLTHKSSHLPTEATLNAEIDALLADYFPALDALMDKLDEINAQAAVCANLLADLADCLAELALREDCEDPSNGEWQDIFDEGEAVDPWTPEVPEVDPPVEEETVEEAAFTDTDGHWADVNIAALKLAEVVSGDSDTGLFRPNDSINRAEAAKIVMLAKIYANDLVIEEYLPTVYELIFSDVLEANWFWSYVHQANTDEIFNGYEDGTFGPANSILRAEAVSVIMRALAFEIPEYTTYSFPDVTGEEWYADYAEMAYQCEIMTGREGDLVGGDNITRAEFSKIVDLALLQDLDAATCSVE